jgi:hypothetical protein
MRRFSWLAGVLVTVTVTCVSAVAQDVCVHQPLAVNEIRGRVYSEVNGKRAPIPDVTVEVAPYGYKQPAATTSVTDTDGAFVLRQVPSGRYYLSVRHASVIGLSVEVRLRSKQTRHKQDTRPRTDSMLIEIVLRNDPSKYCGGATATLLREASPTSTSRPKEP